MHEGTEVPVRKGLRAQHSVTEMDTGTAMLAHVEHGMPA
jgi:hypothetical protein